jgi:hypothetical protein
MKRVREVIVDTLLGEIPLSTAVINWRCEQMITSQGATDMVKSNLAGIALFAMASPSTSQVGHCVRRHTVQAN